MKKFVTVLILICIILLLALDVKIIMGLNYITDDLTKEIEFLQTQINDLKDRNNDKPNIVVEKDEDVKEDTPLENAIENTIENTIGNTIENTIENAVKKFN